MKKMTLLATVVSAMVFGMSAQANPTAAPDGTIKVMGKIVDNTCSVTTGTNNKTVTLPTVSVSAFTAEDQSVAPTAFQIGLQNCKHADPAQNGTTVRLFFTPANVAAFNQTKGVLNNTYQAAGGKQPAQNVGVQLLTKNREHIPVGKDYGAYTQTGDKTPLAQNVFMDYFAAYYAIATGVTAGEVEATVTYNIVYD